MLRSGPRPRSPMMWSPGQSWCPDQGTYVFSVGAVLTCASASSVPTRPKRPAIRLRRGRPYAVPCPLHWGQRFDAALGHCRECFSNGCPSVLGGVLVPDGCGRTLVSSSSHDRATFRRAFCLIVLCPCPGQRSTDCGRCREVSVSLIDRTKSRHSREARPSPERVIAGLSAEHLPRKQAILRGQRRRGLWQSRLPCCHNIKSWSF